MMRAGTALVALCFVALTACGGEESGQDRDDATPAAAPCPHDEETLIPALEAAVPEDATARMTMAMSGPGVTMTFEGTIAYQPSGIEADLTLDDDGDEIAIITTGGRIFLRTEDTGGWLEVEDSNPAAAEMRETIASLDVSESFVAWDAGLEEVEPVGEEQIEGEDVCHYTVTVDSAAAAEAQGEELPKGMPETVDYELFLGEGDLVRRITFDLYGVKAAIDSTRWNEPVTIEVPTIG